MSKPYRIITVCTGNICRSPMAEYQLRAAFERAGLGDLVEIDSAGTTSWEAGNPMDRRAAAELRQHGIEDGGHVARRFRPEWFEERDLVLALDDGHRRDLQRLTADPRQRAKVQLVREFDPSADGDLSIEDPWYGGPEDFVTTWDQIDAAVPGIVDYVRDQLRVCQQ